jgi:hypothetical protein
MESEKEIKELDLIDLLKLVGNWIGNGIKSIVSFFSWIIKFSIQNWYVILFFLGVGVALAFYFSQSKYSKYDGILVIENNVGNSTEFYTALQSLASYMDKEDENGSFSTKLNIPSEVGKKIARLQPLYIYTSEDEGLFNFIDEKKKFPDLEPHQRKFAVLIKSRDRSSYPLLKTALVEYFENHPFFKSTNDARMKFLHVQERALEEEILTLDSLKNLEYFEANSKTKNLKMDKALLIGESKTQLYHTNILEMSEKLQLTRIDIATRNNVVTVSSDFTISPPNNTFIKYLVIFCASFYLFGFIVALLIRKRLIIKEFLK